jgi:glycosyltransferase involved in cell wall biosynthesis
MPGPLVSVILPSYNRAAQLRAAVESVFAQTSTDWELLIADDGSEHSASSYLQSLDDARVRVLWLEHCGVPAVVRNAAIAVARGRYLAFLDSDDVWLPHKLQRQLALMQAWPQRHWSYTQVHRITACGAAAGETGVRPWRAFEGDIVDPLLRLEVLIATPSVIAARELVSSAGGFDEQQRFCEDYDLWLRLAMRSEVSAFAEPLACVRVHEQNYSSDRIAAHEGWVRLYAKHARAHHGRRRSLCRRLEADSRLTLAALYARAGRRRESLRALARSLPQTGWRPAAWPRLARVLARLLLPLR